MSSISERVRKALVEVSRELGVPIGRVLDAYFGFNPARYRIRRIVEDGGSVTYLELVVEGSRPGTVYLAKYARGRVTCTCPAASRGRVCRHAVAAAVAAKVVEVIEDKNTRSS